jgi:O-antigen chain-terminating methyltransferase
LGPLRELASALQREFEPPFPAPAGRGPLAALKAYLKSLVYRTVGTFIKRDIELTLHVLAHMESLEQDLARLRQSESDELAQLRRVVTNLVAENQRLSRDGSSGHGAAPQGAFGYDSIDYVAFEARFRGAREMVRSRQEIYLPYFRDQAPILDVGCGRGEFLELLKANSLEGRGIDLSSGMVEFCRSLDLDVELSDVFDYLGKQPDDSLGGIFLGQVVEHMPPAAISAFFEMAEKKLRPGGLVIAETVNPLCPSALANFYLDPTHERPVHPDLLMFLAETKGLAPVEFLFSAPIGDFEPFLRTSNGQPAGGSYYRDYALICQRPARANKGPAS